MPSERAVWDFCGASSRGTGIGIKPIDLGEGAYKQFGSELVVP